jgi:hypothetical protein
MVVPFGMGMAGRSCFSVTPALAVALIPMKVGTVGLPDVEIGQWAGTVTGTRNAPVW